MTKKSEIQSTVNDRAPSQVLTPSSQNNVSPSETTKVKVSDSPDVNLKALREAHQMLKEGILTEDEYNELKRKLISA